MKILAIASAGGHWIQLLRLLPSFNEQKVVFVSTKENFKETVKGHKFYAVPDGNRWSKVKLILMSFSILKIILVERPKTVITTGAAPGLAAIIFGRLIGAKTIWIDSIANVDRISMSGRIALRFANKFYTQWPHLATSKIIFNGNILS